MAESVSTWVFGIVGTLLCTGLIGLFGWLWKTNSSVTVHEVRLSAVEASMEKRETFEADIRAEIKEGFERIWSEVNKACNLIARMEGRMNGANK